MKAVGEHAWLLSFEAPEEPVANERARTAAALLRASKPEGLLEAIPAARTLFVAGTPAFDPARLAGLEERAAGATPVPSRSHEILVTLDGEDLPEVCAALGLTPVAFRDAFLAASFTVGFLGFSPGFAYLYGLPPVLRLPRRTTPRTSVPGKSLAMAGPYVGIYPVRMPGGWNLLGTAAGDFFDVSRQPPALFSPGDRVRFVT